MRELTVVVDMANVVGSRPDGWWRDRAGAATRLLAALAGLPGRDVADPGGGPARVGAVVAVLEGAARAATDPQDAGRLTVVRAVADGDTAVVEAALSSAVAQPHGAVVVVTSDRGLRARLPEECVPAGPRWLLDALGS